MNKLVAAVLCATVSFLPIAAAPAAITKVSATVARAAVKPLITTITQAQLTAALTGGAYSGVGSLFVSYAHTAVTGFGALCTGSLTSANTVLTAGHCLYDYDEEGKYDPVTSITFYSPSRGERTPALTYQASSWTVDPNYNGDVLDGSDLSMFTLSTKAQGQVYDIFTDTSGSEINSAFTRVGTGTTGDKTGTAADGFDYKQRAGENLYEYYADDIFSDVAHNILMSDFDDGSAAHDVFGRAGGNVQRGLTDAFGNVIDTNSSPGDSGGPEFIDGKIAGITSFGITGAVFDGVCGSPSDFDPYAAGTACTNSSIGEMAGDTQVSAYADWIHGYIAAAAVPEPSSWAMMLFGFGALGSSLRRRARTPARI